MLKAMIVSLALITAPFILRADEAAAPAPTPENKAMHGHGMEGKAKRDNAGKKTAKAKPGHKDHYTCPMDGGDFDAPGQCPKCHMELVKVEPKGKAKGAHPEPEAGKKK